MTEKVPDIAGGVPAGGTAGQALVKLDGTDYNYAWGSGAGVPTPASPGDNNKALVANGGSYTWQILGPAGGGAPSGGTANQVLKKNSGSNYDYSWGAVPGAAPVGGSTSQVLTKTSGSDYAYSWQTPNIPDWKRIYLRYGTGFYAAGGLTSEINNCFTGFFGGYPRALSFKVACTGIKSRNAANTTSFFLRLAYSGPLSTTLYSPNISIGLLPSKIETVGVVNYAYSLEFTVVLVYNYITSGTAGTWRYLLRLKGCPTSGGSPFTSETFVDLPYDILTGAGTLTGFDLSSPAGYEIDTGRIEAFTFV